MNRDIKSLVKNIVLLLASEKYNEITATINSKLSAAEMKTIIDDFGETIFIPNNDIFNAVDIVQIENSDQEAYSVDFDLWTKESGMSDLTLQLTVTKHLSSIEVELDNIHVL